MQGECWIWQGCGHPKGYGRLKHQGRTHFVHRFVYELVYRGAGEQIMHSCDVRLCCNPAHLSNGTNRENVLDCHEKGRRNYQQDPPTNLTIVNRSGQV